MWLLGGAWALDASPRAAAVSFCWGSASAEQREAAGIGAPASSWAAAEGGGAAGGRSRVWGGKGGDGDVCGCWVAPFGRWGGGCALAAHPPATAHASQVPMPVEGAATALPARNGVQGADTLPHASAAVRGMLACCEEGRGSLARHRMVGFRQRLAPASAPLVWAAKWWRWAGTVTY